jgi:hypothetical protein
LSKSSTPVAHVFQRSACAVGTPSVVKTRQGFVLSLHVNFLPHRSRLHTVVHIALSARIWRNTSTTYLYQLLKCVCPYLSWPMSSPQNEKLASESQSVLDPFDTVEDRKLVRKIDFRCGRPLVLYTWLMISYSLIPILTLLYLLSFLDRYLEPSFLC